MQDGSFLPIDRLHKTSYTPYRRPIKAVTAQPIDPLCEHSLATPAAHLLHHVCNAPDPPNALVGEGFEMQAATIQ
jgi:hypothetical protein